MQQTQHHQDAQTTVAVRTVVTAASKQQVTQAQPLRSQPLQLDLASLRQVAGGLPGSTW